MSTASTTADHGAHGHGHGGHEEHVHPPSYYVKTWGILVVLLVISLLGPELGIRPVTIATAFGIAVIKAWLVCSRFMHLNIQPKYVIYFLVTALAFMALFFFAIAPDILNHHGANWVNVGAKAEIERHGGHDGGGDVKEAPPAHGEAPAHGGGGDHGGGHDGGHGAAVEESPELKAHKAAAAQKLQGIEAAMKAVESEVKGAAATTPPTPTPTPTTPPTETPPPATPPPAEAPHH